MAGGIVVSNAVSIRNGFGQFISEMELGVDNALDELEVVFGSVAKQEAPSRRGVLRARTRAVRVGNQVRAQSKVYYAEYVQDGTPPHTIAPKSGGDNGEPGYLANPAEGFFARGKVLHPGTKPNPYLLRAYKIVWPLTMDIIDRNVN